MDFDSSQPIWQQLVAEFTRRIIIGEWEPGMKIPSTRELALDYKVNPNTVQRALAELDRNGTTKSERTSGRFVTGDTESLNALRNESAQDILRDAIARLQGIGVTQDRAVELLKKYWGSND
ncbi:MAG TPA: GntR family transcriptional regulator [Enteractinococcus sp.]